MPNKKTSDLTIAQQVELRRRHVETMNANMRLEGLYPDASDIALQARYVRGEATLSDLYDHALDFARKSQVQADLLLSMQGDEDTGMQEHLDAGHPIIYLDEQCPGHIIRQWPDGRREALRFEATGELIVFCNLPRKKF